MFPLQQYITELSDSYPAAPVHTGTQEAAESATLIEEGSCVYQAHLQSYPVQPGDLILLPPMTLHAISSIPGTGMRSETYVFHMNFLGINSADVCAVRYLTPLAKQKLIPPFVIRKDHPAYGEVLLFVPRDQPGL